ncbi:MAG: cyclase family protein, partial [Planctomycetes bacterium]|nr:cyclase family protein [Planctomycetota bacterium]
PDCIRLLLRTTTSAWWARGDTTFHSDFCAFSEEGAQWIVEQGIALVGVDYLSVQPWKAERRVHQILLQAGVIVVEGLNLDQAAPGDWELFCLPLRLTGADGAPARVMLRRLRAA